MAITRNEVIGILGLLGITGTAQEGATEGGFILPDFITQLAQTVPLPVLVVVGAIAYYVWKKEGGDRSLFDAWLGFQGHPRKPYQAFPHCLWQAFVCQRTSGGRISRHRYHHLRH